MITAEMVGYAAATVDDALGRPGGRARGGRAGEGRLVGERR